MSGTEPFPQLTPVQSATDYPVKSDLRVRQGHRRKGSSLGGDPRGDTATPALATMYDQSSPVSSVNSPILKSSSTSEKSTQRSKRKKVKSLFQRWKTISLKHTWLNPLIISLVVLFIYACNPSSSNPVYPALFLSHALPTKAGDDGTNYTIGSKDFAFVAFYTVVLSFTREFIMQRMLRPLAIKAGIRSRGKQARFMEQAYTAIYFAIFGPFGVYVMSKSDVWFFNTTGMYEGFPHRSHPAIFKAYYLLQAAYWAQQMIVLLLMLEKPRKDFKELIAHHIITLSLIYFSYAFHFTRMGMAVYITHDISDFFLATSKVLNYLDSPIVVPYFVFFMGTWVYLRHYINLRIIVSMLPLPSPFPDHITGQIHQVVFTAYTSTRSVLDPILIRPFTVLFPSTATLVGSGTTWLYNAWNTPSQWETVGPYTLNWDTQQYKCWISQWITFGLLASLQAVNIFWLFFICRILWRALITLGQEARDDRSEDDSDEERETYDEKPEFVDTGKSSADTVPDEYTNGKAEKH